MASTFRLVERSQPFQSLLRVQSCVTCGATQCTSFEVCCQRPLLALQITTQTICRDKNMFVATKDVLCRDKSMLVATKMIFVADPASDTSQPPHMMM